MSRPASSPNPGSDGRDPRATVDANAEVLQRYVASIDATPPAELAGRVLARLSQEPRRTPPGRLVAALASLSPWRIRVAFRRNLDAATGRLTVAPIVRAQALVLVAVLVLSVGALGSAGAVVLRSVIDRGPVAPTHPLPTVGASPSPSPTAIPTPSPTPTPSPVPTPARTVSGMGGPTTAPSTLTPVVVPPVGGTPRPAGNETPRPGATPDTDRTPKPHPTPGNQRPDRPERTPRPRPTPNADRTPKPHPTPKAGRAARSRTPKPGRTP